MSAHNFPKSRETRPVKIAELVQYRERLPEKISLFSRCSTKDPEENEAIVRFSRKEKKQYVTSEKREKRRNGLLISPMENGLNERNKKKVR